jgi:hypothetical protein
MAKKALVSTIEPRGKDNAGYRVLEVVDAANTFEVHSNLQWHDCADTVEMDKYWYDPNSSSFKKLPETVDAVATAGELEMDDTQDPPVAKEAYEWNWDTESWSKVQIINQ